MYKGKWMNLRLRSISSVSISCSLKQLVNTLWSSKLHKVTDKMPRLINLWNGSNGSNLSSQRIFEGLGKAQERCCDTDSLHYQPKFPCDRWPMIVSADHYADHFVRSSVRPYHRSRVHFRINLTQIYISCIVGLYLHTELQNEICRYAGELR